MKTTLGNKYPSLLKDYRWILTFCGLFLLVHHQLAQLGFYGMDDINYARYAATLKYGNFNWFSSTDHFAHRWIPIVVTGIAYYFLGINDFTSAFFGLLSTLGSCWALLRIMRHSEISVQLLSLALFLFTYSTVFAAHRLWPDSGIVFFLLAALNSYLHHSPATIRKHAFIFSACFFATLLCKETALLFLPLITILLFRDLTRARNTYWWKLCIGIGAVFLLLYFGAYWYVTGNPLYRYHVLQTNNYHNSCSFDQLPISFTLKRISYELGLAFLKNGDGLLLLPAICRLIYRKKITSAFQQDPIPLYFFILLMSSNFMSFSLTSYLPLCQDTRHFLFLLPLAAITASPLLLQYIKTPGAFPLLPWLFLSAFLLLYFLKAGEIQYVYLLLALFFLLLLFFQKSIHFKQFNYLYPVILAGIFLVRPVYDFIKPTYPQFTEHKQLVLHLQSYMKNIGLKHATLYTNDSFTSEMTEYFLKFDQQVIRTETMNDSTRFLHTPTKNFLLMNQDPPALSAPAPLLQKAIPADTLQTSPHFILLMLKD